MGVFILDSLSSYCLICFFFLVVIGMAAGTHEGHREGTLEVPLPFARR